jgi:hypothetical protein
MNVSRPSIPAVRREAQSAADLLRRLAAYLQSLPRCHVLLAPPP